MVQWQSRMMGCEVPELSHMIITGREGPATELSQTRIADQKLLVVLIKRPRRERSFMLPVIFNPLVK